MTDVSVNLSTLRAVPIRKVFKTEDAFSDWLANNIRILEKCLNLPAINDESVHREKQVGAFSADIVTRTVDGQDVVIENQFGGSDHDHLGKTLTYAAGVDADIIIWLVENARWEHRSVVNWLNEHSPDKFFFLAEIKVYRIDKSLPAVDLRPVEVPNEWEKMLREKFSMTSDAYELYMFFSEINKRLENKLQGYEIKPAGKSSGKSEYYIFYTLKSGKYRGQIHFEVLFYHRPQPHFVIALHLETPEEEYNVRSEERIFSQIRKRLEDEFRDFKIKHGKWGRKWARIQIEVNDDQKTNENAEEIAELAARFFKIVCPVAERVFTE